MADEYGPRDSIREAPGLDRVPATEADEEEAFYVGCRGTEPIMRELLIEMTIPRLYVFVERSLPDEDRARLPGSGIEVAVVPEGGHAMMMDNPPGIARVVGAFLNRNQLVQ